MDSTRAVFRALAGLLLLLAGACGEREQDEAPLVLAAASLQGSLDEAADAWASKGHQRPVLSFAGTAALARQVEGGAPADIFISADQNWMDDLAEKGLIRADSRTLLLRNTLALIAPAGTRTKVRIVPGMDLAGALGDGRLAIADPQSVPAGRYGREALESLGAWQQVRDRLVPTDNVRLALALVARGEARLGIVYATDALDERGVHVVESFPEGSHSPIVYPMAILSASHSREAERFRAFLMSDEAMELFRKHGFQPAGTP